MKNIVTIGGGTGSFTLLSGLKNYAVKITAIVSMADDGGSTGRLRDELGVLPPGDVRQCLVALSDESKEMRDLFNYRFEAGELKGHNFGNLFLSALEKVSGGFAAGVKEASKILNTKGEVVPVTDDDINLFIDLKDGKKIKGEDEINHNYELEKVGIEKIYINPPAKANKDALRAIKEADLIVIGPGNHYCSIVPNFLVKGIPEAIMNSKAKIVYNCNLVNKKGHTENFDLDDYAESINGFLGGERIDFVTYNSSRPSERLIAKYKRKRESLVEFDRDKKKRKYRIVNADVLSKKKVKYSKSDALASQRAFIRHDSDRLAKTLMMIMDMDEYRSIVKEIV
ncbi:uridine diphosphate-N-acetylglucosamine-binding protein YvcK [Patescibacteria group bacterium]